MSIDLVKIGEQVVKKQFAEIVKDAETIMKGYAPHPTGAERGKGSYATGETKRGIRIMSMSDRKAFVGVENDHAKYADDGRGAIRKNHLMRWQDKRGRWHAAYAVAPMEGWHFVEKTKEAIIAKYGGK